MLEASRLSEDELGAFLRREGLHEADLDEWRDAMIAGLKPPPSKHARSQEARRVKQLEKELHRKDKALAEAAALLVLQKKSPGPLGGRGRRHEEGERRMTIALIDEAVNRDGHRAIAEVVCPQLPASWGCRCTGGRADAP